MTAVTRKAAGARVAVPAAPPRSKSRAVLWGLFVLLVFALLRTGTAPHVYSSFVPRLIDPDSYYHIKRILFTLADFPAMLTFDPFLSHPGGDVVPWPPLFDLLSAIFSMPFENPLHVLPAVDLFWGAAALMLLYVWLLRAKGLAAAVCGGLVFALSGLLANYQKFGRIDHHALEIFIVTAFYILYIEHRDGPSRMRAAVLAALVAAAFLNWPGALVYFCPALACLFYQAVRGTAPAAVLGGVAAAFAGAGIALGAYLVFGTAGTNDMYSFRFLSGFSRDFCFVAAFVFGALFAGRRWNVPFRYAIPVVCVACGFFFYRFFGEIAGGLLYVGKAGESSLMGMVEESAPLFFGPNKRLVDELLLNLYYFTPLLFVFPVFLYNHIRRGGRIELAAFTMFFFLGTVVQHRFGIFFMVGFAIMAGEQLATFRGKTVKIAALAATVFYSGALFRTDLLQPSNFVKPQEMAVAAFLAEKTPLAESFDRAETPYGVLSSWHLGHYIVTLGRRPAVAHNFIAVAPRNGERKYLAALFSRREEDVLSIMDATRSPFIVVDEPTQTVLSGWPVTAEEPNPYITERPGGFALTGRAAELFLYRLYFEEPAGDGSFSASSRLRLVFDTQQVEEPSPSDIKVYERVAGAQVVSALPGAKLTAVVVTPRRRFLYAAPLEKTAAGSVFRIPYSLDTPYDVRAESVTLEINGTKRPLTITEQDVYEGRLIRVP